MTGSKSKGGRAQSGFTDGQPHAPHGAPPEKRRPSRRGMVSTGGTPPSSAGRLQQREFRGHQSVVMLARRVTAVGSSSRSDAGLTADDVRDHDEGCSVLRGLPTGMEALLLPGAHHVKVEVLVLKQPEQFDTRATLHEGG